MLSNAPTPPRHQEESSKCPDVIDDLFSYSATLTDSLADMVFDILNQYSISLDTTRYPAGLYAESILYMIYWFHRLRDPMRKNAIEDNISKYLHVDRESAGVKALLSDPTLKLQAKNRIDQGVMVRKTVDVLVMRDGQNGREFLTLDRSFFQKASLYQAHYSRMKTNKMMPESRATFLRHFG
ncbi:MAG: hypothetical protein B0W54_19445 [Cellvibrio sp. 79]|nr:MAG: hypothetical protein B0W54_19445 [Cellvibrio sp. 79]